LETDHTENDKPRSEGLDKAVDQFPEVGGAQNGRPSLRIGNLLKGAEPGSIEAVDPIIRNGELAAHAFGSFQQSESSLELVDDAISLVDANGKSQIPELGPQHPLLASRKRPDFHMSCHPVLPKTGCTD
jgi:hypothetical protein